MRGVHDMQRLIAFNDFPRDPLSLNDSCNAIACRQVGSPTRPPATLLISIDLNHDISHAPIIVVPCPSLTAHALSPHPPLTDFMPTAHRRYTTLHACRPLS